MLCGTECGGMTAPRSKSNTKSRPGWSNTGRLSAVLLLIETPIEIYIPSYKEGIYMPTKASRRNTTKNPYPHITAINNYISASFKNSNIPALQEMTKVPEFLGEYMRNSKYFTALFGSCYIQFYTVIKEAVINEAAVMAQDVLAEHKTIYPGVWSDHLLTSLAERLVDIGVPAVDRPGDGLYVVVKSIDAELAQSKDKRIDWNTEAYLSERPDTEVMKYDDYSDERFTQILIGLATAIVSRCMLLSANKYAALITTKDAPSQPIQFATQFKSTIGKAICDWVDGPYGEIGDGKLAEMVDSFTKSCIDPILSFISTLAVHGGLNSMLIDATIAGSSITPMCDSENFSEIMDPKFKIVYVLNYKSAEKPISATFEIFPATIFSLICDDKPTKTTYRAVGRMLRGAMIAFIRYCGAVLSEHPDVITAYTETLPKPKTDPLPDGVDPSVNVDITDTSPSDSE